jgi:hypothetical protein
VDNTRVLLNIENPSYSFSGSFRCPQKQGDEAVGPENAQRQLSKSARLEPRTAIYEPSIA